MKNFTLEAKKLIEELLGKREKLIDPEGFKKRVKQTLSSLDTLIFDTLIKEHTLTKEEFRNILCEFPPSIAKDSGQPEWTTGEMNRVWDFITGKKKWIFK